MIAFALDKPEGMTSQQALSAIKRKFKIKKLGHTGTLDPFATGVLPVFIGEATKLIAHLDDSKKDYSAVLQLGSKTDTQDSTGTVIVKQVVPSLQKEDIEEVLEKFLGEQWQTPPQYSAIKVQGKPMYKYAREGQEVKLEARKIKIYSLNLTSFENGQIAFDASVSRGTYIRSLGESIAEALGSVGHLNFLRRTRSGSFNLKEAIRLEQILSFDSLNSLENRFSLKSLFPEMLHLEMEDEILLQKIQRGQKIPLESFQVSLQESQKVFLYFKTSPLCLAEPAKNTEGSLLLQPLRVFAIN